MSARDVREEHEHLMYMGWQLCRKTGLLLEGKWQILVWKSKYGDTSVKKTCLLVYSALLTGGGIDCIIVLLTIVVVQLVALMEMNVLAMASK